MWPRSNVLLHELKPAFLPRTIPQHGRSTRHCLEQRWCERPSCGPASRPFRSTTCHNGQYPFRVQSDSSPARMLPYPADGSIRLICFKGGWQVLRRNPGHLRCFEGLGFATSTWEERQSTQGMVSWMLPMKGNMMHNLHWGRISSWQEGNFEAP